MTNILWVSHILQNSSVLHEPPNENYFTISIQIKVWAGTVKPTQWECNFCGNCRICWDSRTCNRVSCASFGTNDAIWRNRINRCSMHGRVEKCPEGTWVLGGGTGISRFYQVYECKTEKQNIRIAIRNAAFGLNIIYKRRNSIFSSKRAYILGGL